ncbi:MAG: hypothetical protein D6E12_02705, partial [Desulfovibrio sp.]
MSGHHFTHMLGARLSSQELEQAAQLLSFAYTRWQQSPKNTNPIETDTSPEVYSSLMTRGGREVILYYEGDTLCGVFVHSMTPDYDQFPLRKLSYVAARPVDKGFEALKTAFKRYADHVRAQGEDVVITTDLDQTTLNDLLTEAGFTECTDRNETYYILSRRLFRPIFAQVKVANDFVVDEIIHCAGKNIRRNKKLFKLQTSAMDFFAIYRRQQESRLTRSVPEENRRLLEQGFAKFQEGVFFLSDFTNTLTDTDKLRGGYSSQKAFLGKEGTDICAAGNDLVDQERGLLFLLPGSGAEMRSQAETSVLRPGFFDFLTFVFKILGSFIFLTDAPKPEIMAVLERFPHPQLNLRYLD